MSTAAKLKDMKWRKVSAPKVWRPEDGEELIDYYAGRTLRDGVHGQYEVATVLVPYKGAYLISGTMLIQLLDTAMLARGDAVRVVYQGRKQLDDDRTIKLFELFVGESPALSEVEMPDPTQPS
jgi:hypothetical protein